MIADRTPAILISLFLSLRQQYHIVGLTADETAVADMCRETNPDVVLLDDRMGGANVIKQIKACCPHAAVVVLTPFGEPSKVQTALDAGAAGHITKATGLPGIVNQLQALTAHFTKGDNEDG